MTGLLRQLIRESIREINAEGVTTFLSNTKGAERVAQKIWQDPEANVDIHRNTDAYNEFVVKFPKYPTQYLRQYKNGEWFLWFDQKKTWKHITKEIDEMTGTGAVAGYMTPRAFKKKKLKEFSKPGDMGMIEVIKAALQKTQYDQQMAAELLRKKAVEKQGSPAAQALEMAAEKVVDMSPADIKGLVSVVQEDEFPPYDAETDTFMDVPDSMEWENPIKGGDKQDGE